MTLAAAGTATASLLTKTRRRDSTKKRRRDSTKKRRRDSTKKRRRGSTVVPAAAAGKRS
jgi:hypothetical protein